MKKINLLLFACLFLILNCEYVPPGNVAVRVDLQGEQKGVQPEELPPGRYLKTINRRYYTFPTFQQNYVWTVSKDEGSPNNESITFQTSEGLDVTGDFGISYHINKSKVTTVFQKYRKGVDEITDIFLRNMVRDALNNAASIREIENIYGMGKKAFMDEVEKVVSSEVAEIGIEVDKLYIIGKLKLPDNIITAINTKIQANIQAQQRENEVAESIAQANKAREEAKGLADAVLIRAEAEAKALRLRRLEINQQLVQYETVQKWDGHLPMATGGGAIPLINLEASMR